MKQFTITSLSAVGAKSLATQYGRFGFKLVSQTFDKKKEVWYNTFKDKDIKEYVSDRVFDGIKPITGKRLERLKAKRAKKKISESITIWNAGRTNGKSCAS